MSTADLNAQREIRRADGAGLSSFLVYHIAEMGTPEAELRARYRSFIESTTDGIYCFEFTPPIPTDLPTDEQAARMLEGLLVECNATCARSYGFERPEDCLGMGQRVLFKAPREHLIALFSRFIEGGYRVHDEEGHQNDPVLGERVYLNRSTGIVVDGHLVRAWGSFKDVTEQRRLEEERRRGQKLEALGRLAAGVAHDFNNALTAIIVTADLLRSQPSSRDSVDRLNEIVKTASGAGELVSKLLRYSRRRLVQPEVVELRSWLRAVAPVLQRLVGEATRVEVEVPATVAHVRIDPSELESVVFNLAANARDAQPRGGALILRLERDEDCAQPAVVLRVGDHGCGMPPNVAEQAFDPFYTTKGEQGAGLGLSSVQGVIHQAGGRIAIDSTGPSGTVLQIRLPEVQPESRLEPRPVEVDTRSPIRVLLVEDNQQIRDVLTVLLESKGHEVRSAEDAEDALSIVAEHFEPDLVVTDLQLPGLSGPRLINALREKLPRLPALLMSGMLCDDLSELVEGPTEFLPKPFRPKDVFGKLELLRTITVD